MESNQLVRLKWNTHHGTLLGNLESLLSCKSMVDVTIAADGHYVQAHKVILCACSPYFQELLSIHEDKHPIIFLHDVKYVELQALMSYMYRGEVNIDQESLAALLRVAESLQIRGIFDANSPSSGNNSNVSSPSEGEQEDEELGEASIYNSSNNSGATSATKYQVKKESVDPTSIPVPTMNANKVNNNSSSGNNAKRNRKTKPRGKRSNSSSSTSSITQQNQHNNNNNNNNNVQGKLNAQNHRHSMIEKCDTKNGHKKSKRDHKSRSAVSAVTNQNQGSSILPLQYPHHNATNSSLAPNSENSPSIASNTTVKYEPVSQLFDLNHDDLIMKDECPPFPTSPNNPDDDEDLKDDDQSQDDTQSGTGDIDPIFQCAKCGKSYTSNKSLWRHRKFACDGKQTFACSLCGKSFSRSDNLRRHAVVAHCIQ